MVVDDPTEAETDLIFRALCDRTRRDILRRAMAGDLSVSGIASHYAMSTTAIQKHVGVLERAGLVERRRRGREQLVQTRIDTISRAQSILEEFEQLWADRLDSLGAYLSTLDTEQEDE